MAIRMLRIEGDPILRKVSREVTELTDNIKTLIEDMKETMYEHEGVGLAAPQVGVLKRVIVVDVSDVSEDDEPNDYPDHVIVLLNPEIIEDITFEANNFFERALCHEIDHLNGILYIDKIENVSKNNIKRKQKK